MNATGSNIDLSEAEELNQRFDTGSFSWGYRTFRLLAESHGFPKSVTLTREQAVHLVDWLSIVRNPARLTDDPDRIVIPGMEVLIR